jgi:hypothetical protein
MRATRTIDGDLAGLLKRHGRELGLPFKDVVNRTLRAGSRRAGETASAHGSENHSARVRLQARD